MVSWRKIGKQASMTVMPQIAVKLIQRGGLLFSTMKQLSGLLLSSWNTSNLMIGSLQQHKQVQL